MDEPVLMALKKRLAHAERVDVSRYRFMNLETVQAAAGELWPHVRDRVFVATRSIIERRVADDDLVIQCATGFLVVFAALSGDAASQLTAKIRDEMETFFLGQADLVGASVNASSQPMNLADFETVLGQAGDSLGSAPVERKPVSAQQYPPLKIAHLVFKGAWDARREAVATYFVRPVTTIERDDHWRPDLAAQLSKPEDRLRFDLALLERASVALGELFTRRSRCALILPVGFNSLSQPRTRSQFITALAALPDEMRPLVWLRLEGIPFDAPAASLCETGQMLRDRVSQVFVQARLGTPSFERYAEMRPHWIGASLPARLSQTVRGEMEHFLALSRRYGLSTYFDTCDSWDVARTATRMGAQMISGLSVGHFDRPQTPYKLSRARLLSRAA